MHPGTIADLEARTPLGSGTELGVAFVVGYWVTLSTWEMGEAGRAVVMRSAVASTFVAALELCRWALVGLDQGEDFGAITVSPRRIDAPDAIRAPVEQGGSRKAMRVRG